MKNRRQVPRLRTLLTGKVVFNGRRSSVDCRIRDMSPRGARLEFGALIAVPSEFTLEIPSKDQVFSARTTWRRGLVIGVIFNRLPARVQVPEEEAPRHVLDA